ncbi:striated muscle preferentially expressed protein kinase [Eublepharis macularius]|uniref:non-specific serine/threonine protein kinase n=1 Tax=Eublepharis macularius TaxID=481883 RepID=A0AA97IVR2_EUBMA|nr:striated muscle preferentially expressed protein kinase [Eublepharis macularius]
MKKAQGLNNLNRATEEAGGIGRGLGRAPPSPAIPPKRAKVAAEEGIPAAPVFLQELKDTATSIGHNILLRVVVTGSPQPHLSWYKEKVPVAPAEEEEKEEEEYGSFWIRNSKGTDGGVYSCIAKNEHGEAVTSATVTVTDMEDSETGEDDASSTQVTQRSQLQDDTTYSSPTGESDTLVDASMKTTPTSVPGLSQKDEHYSWPGSQTTVLEKDPDAGPTVRGPYLHPSIPRQAPAEARHLGVEPLVRASRAELIGVAPGSEDSLSLGSDPYGSAFSLYRGRALSLHVNLPHGGYRRDDTNNSSKTSTNTLHPPAQKPPLQRPVSPRAGQCPVQPPGASCGPTPPVAPRRKLLMPPEFQDTASEEFDEKLKRPKSSGYSQTGTGESRPQTPLSEASSRVSVLRPSPKLPRSGSKIFDKLRFFEERRKSLEQNENPFVGHTWLPLRKTRSFDQAGFDGASPFMSAGSHEDLQEDTHSEWGGVACRRHAFHQKAASLDERGRFSSHVYDLEHKFTEELGRIKRTVSQQQLRRSQELFRSPSPRTSTEPPAPRVPPPRKLKPLKALPPTENAHGVQQLVLSSVGLVAPRDELKGIQKPLSRNGAMGEPNGEQNRGSKETEMNGQDLRQKVEQCPLSCAAPLGRRTGPLEGTNSTDGGSVNTSKGSRESKGPGEASHVRKRESGQDGHSVPWAKTGTELGTEKSKTGTHGTNREPERKTGKVSEKKDNMLQPQEGKSVRSRGKGRRTHRMSPEPESSDDSYISAGEDPLEAPIFEIPIQDVTVTAGTEVLLKCIITGNPSPEVSWRKDGIPFRSSSTRPIKAEGERHTLLVRSARVADGGLYTVCATNEVGEACCSAILTVRPAPPESHSRLAPHHELSSPVTSDEEYLSPLEELPEAGTPRHHRVMRVQPRSEIGPAPVHVGINFKAAPSFEVTLSDQTILEGHDVVLRVQVQGEPKPIVHWLKNRHPIKYGRRISTEEEEGGSFCLHIRMVECTDAGYYACKAINEYGTKQCEAKLDVQVHPETQSLAVLAPLQDVVVGAGDAALFECLVSGPPDVDVDWLWRGRLLQPALLQCKMHFDGRKCKLLLTSVHEDDSGVYTCKLSTAKDELTCSAKLTVWPSRQPLFTHTLETVAVVEGRTARFDCKISGEPPPTVIWTRFGQPVQEGETVRLQQDRGLHSLVLLHVSSEDEGQYGVSASNKHGRAECSAELYVEEPRPAASSQISKLEKMPSIPEEPEQGESEVERFTMPDFLRPLHDLDVVDSKEAVLECQVAGLPYPSITWFHNGQRVESTDDRRMMQYKDVHRLVFVSVSHAHAGVYKSVIANKVGKATCYAHLYVTDVVPTPPDGPPTIATVTGRAVTLQWNKPKWLDSAIDPASVTYTLQQQILGTSNWTVFATGVHETSYTILALTKGIRYLFRVLTTTAKANSKPSPPSDPVQLLDRGPYLEEAPLILDKPDVVYAVEGQPVCITVTLNHVEVAVTWRRSGVVLKDGDPAWEMSMPDDDQHSLRFFRVGKGDVGELTCEVSNQHGYDHCFISLELAEAPCFESIMEDIEVGVGETPQFAVVVEGKPLPDIMWYKDEVLLTESNHLSFVYEESECSLVVLNTTEQDSGVYTCIARNLAGEVSCKAELVVRAVVPDADAARAEEESHTTRRLADYYDVHEEISRGAFSYVRRVTQKSSGLAFAAKFIPCRAKAKKSARRELGILAQLDHEHIVYFHDAFEKRNAIIIVMELCTGEELLERIARKSSVSESEIRSYMRQVLEGINYLHHHGILHLDIKPENLLLAELGSDQVRICDFGNAQELTPDEPQYCKYGTPEFVSPEIISQSPVSNVTDVWPVGVITYLCLTGISPFVGENDKTTLMNIRNYNVAFEESMFTGLTREAKGFVIKVLVNDRLRPNAEQTLEHPWFKTLAKGKSISTDHLKLFISRRRWQRSQISYKCNMVPRPIPELLEDTSSHLSIAVPRLLKETSVLSSSSDSDDPEELPYIPMPHQPEFSGSRMSLTEIPTDDEPLGPDGTPVDEEGTSMEWQDEEQVAAGDTKRKEEVESSARRQKSMLPRKRSTEAEELGCSDEETRDARKRAEYPRKALKKGSSLDSPETSDKTSRKGELRRGSSADSALLLNLPSDEAEYQSNSRKRLTKAASMELPRRSPSPGTLYHRKGGLPEEEYTQRLELMRQRLLRGSPVDGKLSGLRGPLLETLGLEKKVSRPPRLEKQLSPGHKMVRAASSETASQQLPPEGRLLQKSSSFSQGDGEPVILHRRSGAPLEIPLAHTEAQRLKETPSLSALNESRPHTPHEVPSKPPTPEMEESIKPSTRPSLRRPTARGSEDKPLTRFIKPDTPKSTKAIVPSRESIPLTPISPTPGSSTLKNSAYAEVMQSIMLPAHKEATYSSAAAPESVPQVSSADTQSHTAVYDKVAAPISGKGSSVPAHSSSTERILDIDSQEVFEAKFKRSREGSLSRGHKLLSRSEERQLVGPQVREEGIYRPSPAGAPLELSKSVASRRLGERSRSVQDLHEVEKETGFIRRMSMRLRRTPPTERRKVKEEEAGGTIVQGQRLSRSLVSKDKKDSDSLQSDPGSSESPVMAVRRKIGTTMERLSTHLRSHSQQHADGDHTVTVGDRIRQPEKRIPLLSQLRRANSEGENLRQVGIPQNQLAAQSANVPSTESFQSETSTGNVSSYGHRRGSRWERWNMSRAKKDKVASQPNLPANLRGDGVVVLSQPYVLSESDFPPVFHIKLKDQVLLEGEAVQLCCLPAASPAPHILWMKDKCAVVSEGVLNIVACKDGRQLLTISKASKKDAGLYECNATNALGTATSSCTLSVARIPGRPGTPEIPQKYRNTVLVLWRPADSQAPCTYTLERKMDGEHEWKLVNSGIADCYFNVTDLPVGSNVKFRVACANKAGQGPYSNPSGKVFIESAEPKAAHSAVTAKKSTTATEKVASSRSTQTPLDQLPRPTLQTTEPQMPSTPPRKQKGSVPALGHAPSKEEKPLAAEKEKATTMPQSSKDASSSEYPAITVSSPEPALKPTRTASSLSAHSASMTTKVSPGPATTPGSSLSKFSPISPASPTNMADSLVTISPKAVPYVATSFVSNPPAAPTDTENASSPLAIPPTEEVPSSACFVSRNMTPSRDTGSGARGRLTSAAKDDSSLRQGVPQKPYTFLDEKARGRFGVIRECKENATGKRFMAKIVPYETEGKQSVLQEYELLKGLHHERIMALHEAYITPRYLVLITEHCNGKEILYHFVDRFRYSEEDVVGYVTQILQGLEYLHGRRIIHLDLKPDNIIVSSLNTVKIIDFGSAQNYNPLVLRQLEHRAGTLEYMAPEMVKGDPIGSAADVWGVGVLTYIMLSGRLPFLEVDPLETESKILAGRYDAFKLYPNVSQSAALFIRKVLSAYPWSRPTIKDCFANPWLQDAYLMKLRRQTLTFTTSRLKEFLVEHQRRRSMVATKHKVLLRSYHGASSHMP